MAPFSSSYETFTGPPAQFVQVPFHGDIIEALQAEDGKILVHFKRVCKSLGMDKDSQVRKLKGRKWCEFVDLTAPDERGRPQQLTMIDLESLPMWLATINVVNVREEIKPKLYPLMHRKSTAQC